MIQIFNVSDNPNNPEGDDYYLYINQNFICSFKHKRIEGLAECLIRAAEAVEKENGE
jgi:hypothetical protein